MPQNNPHAITPKELFWTFSKVSLCGFGGVAPWLFQSIVEKKKWLSAKEYGELLGIGQILPGPNVTNFSAMFGLRILGWRGAIAATSGLLLFPFFLVIGLGTLYQHFGSIVMVQGALRGITSAAAGLVVATSIKLARSVEKARLIILGLFAFGGVGLLHYPLPYVVLIVGGVAIATEWWSQS